MGQVLKYWNKSQRVDFFFPIVEKKDLENERLGAKVVTKCRETERENKPTPKNNRGNKGTNKWVFRACNASGQTATRSRYRERE